MISLFFVSFLGSQRWKASLSLLDEQCSLEGRPQLPFLVSDNDCQPPCKVLHSHCVNQECRCISGYSPTYLPAPILSSRPPTLVFCQKSLSNAVIPNSNSAMSTEVISDHNGTVVPMSYFPGMKHTCWLSKSKKISLSDQSLVFCFSALNRKKAYLFSLKSHQFSSFFQFFTYIWILCNYCSTIRFKVDLDLKCF